MKNILLNAQINDCILVENDEIKRTAEGQKDDTAEAGYGTEHESDCRSDGDQSAESIAAPLIRDQKTQELYAETCIKGENRYKY